MYAVFKQNVKKFNAIARTKNFFTCTTARNTFTDTNSWVEVAGELKKLLCCMSKFNLIEIVAYDF